MFLLISTCYFLKDANSTEIDTCFQCSINSAHVLKLKLRCAIVIHLYVQGNYKLAPYLDSL
jgi:hypothetical protein